MTEEEKILFESRLNEIKEIITNWVENMKSEYGEQLDFYFDLNYSDLLMGIYRETELNEIDIKIIDNNTLPKNVWSSLVKNSELEKNN
jgi:hypothetical protein